jgi:hypothetical protein
MLTLKALKFEILRILAHPGTQKAHKVNMIGRSFQSGDLERQLNMTFTSDDRALASDAFETLKADGYIQSTFDDLVDPENWVAITESGRQFLKAGLRDAIDLRLAEISEHLIELRAGMWDAAGRKSPDAPRQAASSARELVDQLLKEGAPVECETRKQRISHLLKKHSTSDGASKSDIEIIEASARLIEAEHNKAISIAHSRGSPTARDARMVAENAERILRLLFRM